MRELIRGVARLVLPRRVKSRRIPFGLARGTVANVNFRYDTAFYFGQHEPVLHPHYCKILKPGMRCFDVGMYRGWDALLFAHLTGGEVVSFDGNPKCLEMTAEFLAPSGVNIRLIQAYLTDGQEGGATLDQAALDYFIPDFMKIDVEGAEVLVLDGAKRILAARQPSLVVEVHSASLEAECQAKLVEYGYRSVTVDRRRGPFSEARGQGHNRWLVCEGRPPA